MHTLPRFIPHDAVLKDSSHRPVSQTDRMAGNRLACMLHVCDIPDFKPGSMRLSAVRAAQAALQSVRTKRGGVRKPR